MTNHFCLSFSGTRFKQTLWTRQATEIFLKLLHLNEVDLILETHSEALIPPSSNCAFKDVAASSSSKACNTSGSAVRSGL